MKSSSNLITGGVIAKIRNMILAAELKPGHRLVEEEFSHLLGVGRTPVREALLLLQGEGFVARNHRGWEVRSLDDQSIQTVFECRAAIEAEVARIAARKMRPRIADALARLVERMEPGAFSDRDELQQRNDEFHRLILEAADNALLTELHERVLMRYWTLGTPVLFNDDQVKSFNQQHRDLLDALNRGAAAEAEEQARLHVESTREVVEAFIQAVTHYRTISNIASLEANPGGRWSPLGQH
jgi:DNA-binding GntR family transcriptional regulator